MRTFREEMLFTGGGQTHLAGVHVAEADLTGCRGGIAGRMEPNGEEAGEEGVGSLGCNARKSEGLVGRMVGIPLQSGDGPGPDRFRKSRETGESVEAEVALRGNLKSRRGVCLKVRA